MESFTTHPSTTWTSLTAINTTVRLKRLSMVKAVLFSEWYFLVTIIAPVLFTIGCFGNVFLLLSVAIQKLYKKSPVFIFLAFIAVSDMISLLTLMIPDYFEQMDVDVTNSFICSLTIYIYHAANKISVYILIAAYLFKLHGLYKPMTLISKNHSQQSVIICLAIFMAFFVIDSYMVILEMHPPLPLTNIVLNGEVVELYACRLSETPAAFPTIYFLVYTFVYVIVPGLALIVLSVAIMVVLRRSYKQHKLLVKVESTMTDVAKPSSSANNVFTSAQATATILVPMSIVHIALTVPRTIILLIYYVTRPQESNFNLLRLYIMNARCVTPINFCINFYVQIVCSKFFRQAILPCTKSAKS